MEWTKVAIQEGCRFFDRETGLAVLLRLVLGHIRDQEGIFRAVIRVYSCLFVVELSFPSSPRSHAINPNCPLSTHPAAPLVRMNT